ncbi:MAG: hypothetical protein IOC64_04795 [Methylobacterium sp.]|jgi:ABC-type protease/lipase transport system fused ATPase/permease subunit|nr:hypothetical protein [Methylobacterium sp.]MCA3599781.1 hypothetical protein [Methylobacterium sp.]MCA3606298.1 hypothetical protein [Methylobacterium sp.]MCA3609703.1 hypothetical protein [Methylobacterium sp.]MCA3618831.1 hypothetical protein [Methylobacterium sp.]
MAWTEHLGGLAPASGLAPLEAELLRAVLLVLAAGILAASGALFVILLYGWLIPSGSVLQLALAAGAALLLIALQFLARARAGSMADRASQKLFARLDQEGEAARLASQPLIRALRGRSFLLAADCGWVPIFLVAVLVLHPLLGATTALAMLLLGRFGAAPEPPLSKPDAPFRAGERRRRLAVSSLRDTLQILLLSLGGALAMGGTLQIGEIVAATLLSLRALGALGAALEDAPALKAAYRSWQGLRTREGIG